MHPPKTIARPFYPLVAFASFFFAFLVSLRFVSSRFWVLSFVAPERTPLAPPGVCLVLFVVLLLGGAEAKAEAAEEKARNLFGPFFGGWGLVKLLFVVGFDVAFGRRT